MSTREQIKQTALKLFNAGGFEIVTLRDVAAAMDKSYGNITYHFPGKEALVTELYRDMTKELGIAMQAENGKRNLLEMLIDAPAHSFQVSMKYIFLYRDYVTIIRSYRVLARELKAGNKARMQSYLHILLEIQKQGYLDKSLETEDLNYLMELSGAMRTFYFLNNPELKLKKSELKKHYIQYVNQLLYPYLSTKGKNIYRLKLSSNHLNS